MLKINKFVGANAGAVTQGGNQLQKPFSSGQAALPVSQPRPQNAPRINVRFDQPVGSTPKR